MELRVCRTCRVVRPGATACLGCSGALSLADAGLFVGETFGKYRIDSILGAGGMGVVYRATHQTLLRSVALKVVVPHVADVSFERRFLREARVLADLKHPHIVEIYDFDVNSWGLPYYVMEHLEGCTLRRLIERAPGGLPGPVLAALLDDVGAGLGFAHRKGVVHRDLKPDNVFVARVDGRAFAKLLDFGIAKLISASADDTTTLTAAGAVVGTPAYLAPEQILSGSVGAQTDQYTLALIVIEALCGRAARAGKSLMQILAEELQRPADVDRLPPAVGSAQRVALERATQPDPSARYPDVAAFVAALGLPTSDRAALGALVPEQSSAAPEGPQVTGTLDAAVRTAPEEEPPATATWLADDARSRVMGARRESGAVSAGGLAAAAHAPATGARRGSAWLFAGLAAVGLVTGVWAWRAGRPQPVAAGGATAELVSARVGLRRTLSVPPDTTGLLAFDGETLVLAAGTALYLQRVDAEGTPLRIALEADQEILGPAQEGGVWLREGARLVLLDPISQKKTPWLARLPALADGAQRVHVSPAGRHVAWVEPRRVAVCEVVGATCQPRFTAERADGAALYVRLSDAYLAVATHLGTLDVYRAADGRQVLRAPLGEAQVHDVALLDDAGRVAVGGWFPYLQVYDLVSGGPPVRVQRQGRTTRLAWIADEPTLWVAGPGGTHTWRAGEGLRALPGGPAHESDAAASDDLLVSARTLAVWHAGARRVSLFDYDGFAPTRRLKLGPGSVWAVAADPSSGRLFAGTSAGTLYAYAPGAPAATAFELHADGITDLALGAGSLASTSDDKTLAVWSLPAVSVAWRSRAHAYLVNQVVLAGAPASLWSSSSDGVLKRWGWPQPDELESVDTRRVVPGAPWALHALWVSPRGEHVLAGTWQHALLDLRRTAGAGWTGRRLPLESRTTYRALELAGLDAVLFVGLYPSRAWLYDLRAGRLERLPTFGLSTYALAAGDSTGEAWALGDGSVVRYVVRRADDGALTCDAGARVATGLGVALSAVRVASRTLAAGLETGEVVWLDTASLAGPTLARVTLGRGRAHP